MTPDSKLSQCAFLQETKHLSLLHDHSRKRTSPTRPYISIEISPLLLAYEWTLNHEAKFLKSGKNILNAQSQIVSHLPNGGKQELFLRVLQSGPLSQTHDAE